jgi:hypothetical protein
LIARPYSWRATRGQQGVELHSNLQGLYRCEYSGDKLDYEATMKLLKTFNPFNKHQPETERGEG